MTLEEIIIAIVRIVGSLPVLWWPFVGGILAVLVDFSDLFMMNLLNLGGVRDYQTFDKWVDQVYMVTFLIVSLRWKGVPRDLAIGLFAYRIVGVVIFEFISWRGILLFFPNVFEFWVLFVAGANRFKPEYEITWKRAALWMVPLLAVKEFQEYVLHGGQWLDKYRAVDVVVDWWQAVTGFF
jgi:hypothetical protein